jgi:ribosomal protein S18 acetylase RimI-like enzyme
MLELRVIRPLQDIEEVESIVSIYVHAFGNEPWNEGFICPICRTTFPISHPHEHCAECEKKSKHILLAEYWPRSTVLADFYREMAKPEPICIVAKASATVGFAWGYRVTVNKELSTKLEAPDLYQRIEGDFFYLDECAIAPSHQGRGIGKALVHGLLRAQNQDRILLRTLMHSRMHALITHMDGTEIVRISRNRVMMTLEI